MYNYDYSVIKLGIRLEDRVAISKRSSLTEELLAKLDAVFNINYFNNYFEMRH